MTTRRALIIQSLALVVTLPALLAIAQAQRRIPLAQLEAMFANMRAKTKWNVDGALLWGYFFLDTSAEKLKQAAVELEKLGYRIVNIEKASGKQGFRLHAEKVETHTPASLNARNGEFYSLSEKYSLASYDRMDVGPAPAK